MPPRCPAFRPDIEGLRGVAILLVVLFHAGVPGLAGGFVGVEVFFVLSGYFITGLLMREVAESGGVSLTEFYGRRSLRLLPPLLVVLLATLAAVMWLYAPIDRPAIATNARAVALYAGNYEFARGAVLAVLLRDDRVGFESKAAILQVGGLLALGFAVLAYDRATPYPGIAALLPALAAVALLVGGRGAPDSIASRALATPPLRWLGRPSYPWYPWH